MPATASIGEFIHGFMHPITGLDHILAMVTVGILAYQIGGRALWLVPTTFLAIMAAGGLLGVAGVSFYFVEPGIAASVVVLGIIVALALKPPVALAMALVAVFAVFHGYAHGIEAPLDGSAAAYGAGFLVATALLHASGIAFGMLVGRIAASQGQIGYRLAGSAVALAGPRDPEPRRHLISATRTQAGRSHPRAAGFLLPGRARHRV